jgi:hypothetical protein
MPAAVMVMVGGPDGPGVGGGAVVAGGVGDAGEAGDPPPEQAVANVSDARRSEERSTASTLMPAGATGIGFVTLSRPHESIAAAFRRPVSPAEVW